MLRNALFSLFVVLGLAVPAGAQPRPVIERIEPTSGPPGTTVQIIGRRIHPHSRILLGEVELEVLRRLPNRWTVRLPASVQSGNIVVQTRWGRFSGPYFRVTAARPAPAIERIEPTQGAPGTEVTIHGQSFSPRLSENTVTLSGRSVVIRSATPTTLRVIVPSGATTAPFVVRVDQAGEVSSPTFTVTASTAVTDFSPRVGPPGTEVTLTGTGFSTTAAENRVFINNLRARVVRATATQLVVALPSNAATGPILVDVQGGGRAQTEQPFTIQYPPQITSVSPLEGPPGASVTITGNHFGADPRNVRVTIGSLPAVLRSITQRRLIVEIPAGATTGKIGITVNGLGPVESARDFRVLTPVQITDFTPRSGPVGAVVTIRGQGFGASPAYNRVTMGSARVQVLTASETELTVRIPSAPSGPLAVSVRNSGEARTSAPFVVTQPPFIARFEPSHGTPGTVVTIHGRNFGTSRALVRVTLNGREMTTQSIADDRITAVVPANATTGPIVVAVRLQGSTASASPFHVGAQPPADDGTPRITAVEAQCTRPGCNVVLRGTGFSRRLRMNRVFFGSRPVRVESATTTELRIALPRGAGTNRFRVDVRGAGVAESQPFTITQR